MEYPEKEIIWTVGIFILQLIGGVYIDQKKYQETYKEMVKKSKDEFNNFFLNIKEEALMNINKYFNNEK